LFGNNAQEYVETVPDPRILEGPLQDTKLKDKDSRCWPTTVKLTHGVTLK
jgi:hypothetical protein